MTPRACVSAHRRLHSPRPHPTGAVPHDVDPHLPSVRWVTLPETRHSPRLFRRATGCGGFGFGCGHGAGLPQHLPLGHRPTPPPLGPSFRLLVGPLLPWTARARHVGTGWSHGEWTHHAHATPASPSSPSASPRPAPLVARVAVAGVDAAQPAPPQRHQRPWTRHGHEGRFQTQDCHHHRRRRRRHSWGWVRSPDDEWERDGRARSTPAHPACDVRPCQQPWQVARRERTPTVTPHAGFQVCAPPARHLVRRSGHHHPSCCLAHHHHHHHWHHHCHYHWHPHCLRRGVLCHLPSAARAWQS